MTSKPTIPSNIPLPHGAYANKGWINYGHFLGTGYQKNRKYKPYNKAQKFVSSLGLKSYKDWRKYCAGKLKNMTPRPDNIPTNPNTVYGRTGDWMGWEIFLGNKITYWSFKKSRKFVRSLGLNSIVEWKKYKMGRLAKYDKKPKEIPNVPEKIYKNNGWINYKIGLASLTYRLILILFIF